MEQEGWVREVVRAVQDTRKRLDLPIEKRVRLTLDVDASLQEAIQAFDDVLRENVLVTEVTFGSNESMERVEAGGKSIGIYIEA